MTNDWVDLLRAALDDVPASVTSTEVMLARAVLELADENGNLREALRYVSSRVAKLEGR